MVRKRGSFPPFDFQQKTHYMKLLIFKKCAPKSKKIKFLFPEISSATNIPGHVILDQIGSKIVIKLKETYIYSREEGELERGNCI